MSTVAELLVKIGADSSGLQKELAAAQRQMKRAFGPDALEMSGAASGILAGIGAAMAAVGTASVILSGKMNASAKAFETLIKDGTNVKTFLEDLSQFAADTPFGFKGLQDSSKKLLAFKFAAQDIIPIMNTLGDTAAMLDSGQDGINSMQRALGQMKAKGKVQAEEVMQLAEAGVNAWQYLADSMGTSVADVMKKVTDGEVGATQGINAILKGMQKDFNGGMAAQAKEIPGLWSTILDNAEIVMKVGGDKLSEALNVKGHMQELAGYLSGFAAYAKSAGIGDALRDLVPPGLSLGITMMGGAITAVAVPAIYLWAKGLITANAAMLPYIAAGMAIAGLAWVVWQNWEPLSTLFGGLWKGMQAGAQYHWNFMKSIALGSVKAILSGVNVLFSAFNVKSPVEIWLQNVDASLTNALSGMDQAKNDMRSAGQVMGEAWEQAKNKTRKSIDELIEGGKQLNKTFTGLSGANADDLGAGKAAKAAEKAYERLEKKAETVSDKIEREWASKAKQELDQLDVWKKQLLADLDESKDANENYLRDVTRLNEAYSARRRKILAEEARDIASIWDKAYDAARDSQERLAILKLPTMTNADGGTETSKVALQKFNIESDFNRQIKNIQDKYRDWAAEYNTSTTQQQEQFRASWTANGLQFQITTDGMVNFKRQSDNEQMIAEQEKLARMKALNSSYIEWREDLESAYNEGNISKYIAQLKTEEAAYQQSLETKKAILDSYTEAWKISVKSANDYMLEGIETMSSGLEQFFSDALSGTESWSDAWRNLKKTASDMMADMVAEWIASRVKMWLIEKIFGGQSEDTSKSAAAAEAAAWWPAAIARSLAEAGGNAGPAIVGMAAASAAGMALSNVTGNAAGGYISGPGTGTSDSILRRLSDGEYVVQASAVRAIGTDNMEMINQGILPGYAVGGLVTGPSLESLGSARYGNASVRTIETVESGKEPSGGVTHIHQYNIKMWDTKDAERWIEDTGGRLFERYVVKRAREFAPVGG